MTQHEQAAQFATKIVMRAVADLKPYEKNARTHSKKQIKEIARSITRFGFTNPVLIDEESMILAGHGRVAAAKLLGWQDVPCLSVSTLSQAEKRAYILADNKLALNAGWDEEILAGELQFLIEDSLELDITLTGFSIAEIDEVLDLGGIDAETESQEDDALPETRFDVSATVQLGEIWQLGPHRVICGDALMEETYKSLLGGECAQMIFADPPYNVQIDGHVMGKGQKKHREFAMASGEMSATEFTAFMRKSFERLAAYSADGSIHFICMDWRHMPEILEAGNSVYTELKNLCVWVKDNGGMGTFYRSRHELVFVFKHGAGPHVNSFELGQHGRYRTNVWNYRGITSGTKAAREELAMHPTVKPVAMIADAIKDCCPQGGIVLDAFGGSGSTLIAAEKTNRRARLIEIDPHYCDTIITRWQRYTHDDAVLVGRGECFDRVKAERMKGVADV